MDLLLRRSEQSNHLYDQWCVLFKNLNKPSPGEKKYNSTVTNYFP